METQIAGLNETLEFLMEHLGDTQTSIGRVINLSQPQVGKRLTGSPPWKYVELLKLAEHWGIPITTMCAGKSAAARWLAEQIIIVADLPKRTLTCGFLTGSQASLPFPQDDDSDVIDLREHILNQTTQKDSLYLLAETG